MTPEEVQKLLQDFAQLKNRLDAIERQDRFVFNKNIDIPKEIGIKFGTSVKSKFAFWNATPVVQPSTISDPSGGGNVDTEARAAIVSLIDLLQSIGLMA